MNTIPTVILLVSLLVCVPSASADAHEGWKSLLEGDSLQGWVDGSGKPAQPGKWMVSDGILHLKGPGGGDLYTAKEYGDFELAFEWKIAPKGNSGVKYRMATYEGKGKLGPEYQVYDDGGDPHGKGSTASLYALVAPDAKAKKLNPVGEWNSSRIVAKGGTIMHFLNGKKVVEITVGSPEWKQAVAESKFGKVAGFGENAKGSIMLQDHGSEVWYRKILIKEW